MTEKISRKDLLEGHIGLLFLSNDGKDKISGVRRILEENGAQFILSRKIPSSLFRSLYSEQDHSEWYVQKVSKVEESRSGICICVRYEPNAPDFLDEIKGNHNGKSPGSLRNFLMDDKDIEIRGEFKVFNTKVHTSENQHLIRDLCASMDLRTLSLYFDDKTILYLLAKHRFDLAVYNHALLTDIIREKDSIVISAAKADATTILRLSNSYYALAGAPIHIQLANEIISTRTSLKTSHFYFGGDHTATTSEKENLTLIQLRSDGIDEGGRPFENTGNELLTNLNSFLSAPHVDTSNTVGFIHVIDLEHSYSFARLCNAHKVPFGIINHQSPEVLETQSETFSFRHASTIAEVSLVGAQWNGKLSLRVSNAVKESVFSLEAPKLKTEAVDTVEEFLSNHPNAFRFVHIGRICEEKGQMLSMQALEMLLRKGADIVLIVAGPIESKEYLNEIEAFVKRTKVNLNVLLLGAVWQDEIREILRRVDALLLPTSYYEGIPRVLIEAARMGVPSICTNIGYCSDAVETTPSKQNGIIIERPDSHLLATAMERLFTDADLAEAFSRNAVKLGQERFSEAKMLENHLRLIFRTRLQGEYLTWAESIDQTAIRGSSIWDKTLDYTPILAELSKRQRNLEGSTRRETYLTYWSNSFEVVVYENKRGKKFSIKSFPVEAIENVKANYSCSIILRKKCLENRIGISIADALGNSGRSPVIFDDRCFFALEYIEAKFGANKINRPYTLGTSAATLLDTISSCQNDFHPFRSIIPQFSARTAHDFEKILRKETELNAHELGLISNVVKLSEQLDARLTPLLEDEESFIVLYDDLSLRNLAINERSEITSVIDLTFSWAPKIDFFTPLAISAFICRDNYRRISSDALKHPDYLSFLSALDRVYDKANRDIKYLPTLISRRILKRFIKDWSLYRASQISFEYLLAITNHSVASIYDMIYDHA